MLETLIYLAVGIFIIWFSYTIWKKEAFFLLAGMGKSPVNKKRLGRRLGILFLSLGILMIITPLSILLFGNILKMITGILALIIIALMLIVIILDQSGF